MDQPGFQTFLQPRQLSASQLEAHLAIVARFEQYLSRLQPPQALENASAEATQDFVDRLIDTDENSYDHLLALARYGRFCQNNALFVAILELLDGEEAFAGLYQRVGEAASEEIRAELFAGIDLPPLGLANAKKAALTRTVMERLADRLDAAAQARVFASSFRDLQDAYYQDDRQKYAQIGDFDRFLEHKRAEFIALLERHAAEGTLFFSQEITPEVVEFVRADPEISQGVRQGNILYVTKIPYMTKQFLAESDPLRKRYFACHCPWARESLRSGVPPVSAMFCQCSAGFHKKSWEVIFDRPLEADVLESVLRGDARCRFAIHLPEEALGG